MLSGERKKFGLRATRKPLLVDGLSNTVIVYDGDTPRFCYVMFDTSLTVAVGKRLPRGLSPNRPAFLHVVHDQHRSKWVVSASYVKDWAPQLLWESDSRPTWIRELKVIRDNEHDNTTETHRAHRTARTVHDHHAAPVAA